MLSYTSEDEIRKYFDTDEALSPEQIDAVRTAWNTTITIIAEFTEYCSQLVPEDVAKDYSDQLVQK